MVTPHDDDLRGLAPNLSAGDVNGALLVVGDVDEHLQDASWSGGVEDRLFEDFTGVFGHGDEGKFARHAAAVCFAHLVDSTSLEDGNAIVGLDLTAVGVFVDEDEAGEVVFSRPGKNARVAAHVRSAANVADAPAGRRPEGVVGSVAQIGQLHVFLEGVFGTTGKALNDVVDPMLELNDLRADGQRTLAGAVAAEPLRADSQTRFAVDVMHRHLIRVFGDRHAHRFKLRSDVGRGVGLLNGAAHSSFPLRVAQGHQILSEGASLGRIVIDEFVLVVGCETQPGRSEHKHGGDHQHHDTDRHQGLRGEHVRAAPPRRVFGEQVGVLYLGFVLQTQHGVLRAVFLQSMDELAF